MKWEQLRSELWMLSNAKQSVRLLAMEIPAHHATVYRWLRGDTVAPRQKMVARLEQMVREHKQESKK